MILEQFFIGLGVKTDSKSVDGLMSKIKQLAGPAAIGLVIHKLNALVGETTKAADLIAKTAKGLGVSTDALQELGFAAERSGASAQQLEKGLFNLSRRIGEGRDGMAQAVRAFDKMGISQADLAKAKPEELFSRIAQGISESGDSATQAQVAMDLFGRSGKDLLPLFKEGASGVELLRKTFRETGDSVDKDFLVASEKYQDTLLDMNKAVLKLKTVIASVLLPMFQKSAEAIVEFVREFRGLLQNTKAVQAALIIFGAIATAVAVNILIAWAPMILTFLAIVAAATLVFLIVEDFLNFLDGKDSVIGRMVDAFKEWVSSIDGADEFISDVTSDVKDLINWIEHLTKSFASLDDIKRFFSISGEDLSEVAGFAASELGQFAKDQFNQARTGARSNLERLGITSPGANAASNTSNSATTNQQISIEVSGAQDPQAVGRAIQLELNKANAAVGN